ncbi:MAG: helix-turn-helix domain-containing protein, partial [Bacteroidales bacterium]|nr:helix-turn-helix domain-containing protein [Bacteroidales bacterium]
MSKKRVSYTSSFKAKVVLAAVRREGTISQIASRFKVHPQMVTKWKAQFVANIEGIFRDGRS